MDTVNNTPFSNIYSIFLSKITDDMFMELTPADTEALMLELFLSAIQEFEFPRVDIFNYNLEEESFNVELSTEEQNIIATYMIVEWLGQQLASVENTRMKYSGTDFKFTSQANHMTKIKELQTRYTERGFHLQRLYKRRRADDDGIMRSTFSDIMSGEEY